MICCFAVRLVVACCDFAVLIGLMIGLLCVVARLVLGDC